MHALTELDLSLALVTRKNPKQNNSFILFSFPKQIVALMFFPTSKPCHTDKKHTKIHWFGDSGLPPVRSARSADTWITMDHADWMDEFNPQEHRLFRGANKDS